MKKIVSVPLMSRIPWANLPSSLAKDLCHVSRYLGCLLICLYSNNFPVSSSNTAKLKCSALVLLRVGYLCVAGRLRASCVSVFTLGTCAGFTLGAGTGFTLGSAVSLVARSTLGRGGALARSVSSTCSKIFDRSLSCCITVSPGWYGPLGCGLVSTHVNSLAAAMVVSLDNSVGSSVHFGKNWTASVMHCQVPCQVLVRKSWRDL